MRLRTARFILQKELLDTLRDKRTLMMMVAMPVLIYPAMLLIGLQVVSVHKGSLERGMSRVAIVAPVAAPIREWLARDAKVEIVNPDSPMDALKQGALDAVVVAQEDPNRSMENGGSANVEVCFDGTEFPSLEAMRRVRDCLEGAAEQLRKARLNNAGLPVTFFDPIVTKTLDTAPSEKATGTLMGLLLPMLMVIMVSLGAFYPAIDLTAGEKERGTFETLLSTPASKSEIVFGKFATVFVLAMTSGLLNLGSMSLTMLFVINEMGDMFPKLPFSTHLPMRALFVSAGVMVPLALLISAVTMSAAVLARSFKEAQNYLTPVMLIVMLPAMVGVMPGVDLGPVTQFMPIVNVVLLFKALMIGKAGLEAAFGVFLSTSVFAMLALLLASWLFQREEVVLSEERGLPLSLRRSDFAACDTLSPGIALAWFAIQTLLLFYGAMWLQKRHLMGGLIITEWGLILGVTVFFLWFVRTDLRRALNLRWVPLPYFAFGGLLAAGSVVWVIQAGLWQNRITPLPEGFKEGMSGIFAGGETFSGLVLVLFTIAASPAICEELLFRGAILSGMRQRLSPLPAILLVGVLFGIFHVSIYRILPTSLLGIMLTYVAVRSGSVFPGMLCHFLINASAVLVSTNRLPSRFTALLDEQQVHGNWLPPWFLALGIVLMVAGFFGLEWSARKESARQEPQRHAG